MIKFENSRLFNDIEIFIRSENINELPKQIYSSTKSNLSPIQAFEVGQEQSIEIIKSKWNERTQYIRNILRKHNEIEQLQKLELIQKQFEIDYERE